MTNEILPTNDKSHRRFFLTHPFETLHDDINRIYDQYVPTRFTHWFSDEEDMNHFAMMDVIETDTALDIKLDIPGVDEADIDVKLNENILTIKGKRETSTDEEKENFRRVERSYGSFIRRLKLPLDIDAVKIDATIKNGVLAINIPKSKKESSKERKIKIKKS